MAPCEMSGADPVTDTSKPREVRHIRIAGNHTAPDREMGMMQAVEVYRD